MADGLCALRVKANRSGACHLFFYAAKIGAGVFIIGNAYIAIFKSGAQLVCHVGLDGVRECDRFNAVFSEAFLHAFGKLRTYAREINATAAHIRHRKNWINLLLLRRELHILQDFQQPLEIDIAHFFPHPAGGEVMLVSYVYAHIKVFTLGERLLPVF